MDVLSEEDAARMNAPMQIDFRFEDTFLWGVIDRIANIISINITLPGCMYCFFYASVSQPGVQGPLRGS